MQKNTSFWTSNLGFIMACVGAAVGLGNIWKFPYMTGTQGGGAFVFIYLLTIFAIAIPVAVAELIIGRKGRSDASTSVRLIAQESHRSPAWGAIGGTLSNQTDLQEALDGKVGEGDTLDGGKFQ